MAKPTPDEITGLLLDWGNGDKAALDRVIPLVYQELRRLARRQMQRERSRLILSRVAIHDLLHPAYDPRKMATNRALTPCDP